jgi:hypothetical protein
MVGSEKMTKSLVQLEDISDCQWSIVKHRPNPVKHFNHQWKLSMVDGSMVGRWSIRQSVLNQARKIFNGQWTNGQVSTKFNEVFESSKRISRWSMKGRG